MMPFARVYAAPRVYDTQLPKLGISSEQFQALRRHVSIQNVVSQPVLPEFPNVRAMRVPVVIGLELVSVDIVYSFTPHPKGPTIFIVLVRKSSSRPWLSRQYVKDIARLAPQLSQLLLAPSK